MAMAEIGAGDFVLAETLNYVIRRSANRPFCTLVLPADQNLATLTTTPILFGSGSEVFDDLGWHSVSANTSRITPTYAGRYMVYGSIYHGSSTATNQRRTQITKNGTSGRIFSRAPSGVTNPFSLDCTGPLEMNGSTDYMELCGYQDSGSTLVAQGRADALSTTTITVIYMGDSL